MKLTSQVSAFLPFSSPYSLVIFMAKWGKECLLQVSNQRPRGEGRAREGRAPARVAPVFHSLPGTREGAFSIYQQTVECWGKLFPGK